MSAFLVKDMPPAIHARLRPAARQRHRSMNREVISILERELGGMPNGSCLSCGAPNLPTHGSNRMRFTAQPVGNDAICRIFQHGALPYSGD